MRRRAIALAVAVLVGAGRGAALRADEPSRWAERVAAARAGEPESLVLALPSAAGEAPSPCVRVERASELVAFLDHLARAEPSSVLLGPTPAPEAARLTLLAREARVLLAVSVTARAFRVDDGAGKALVFRSPTLLRWTKDRLGAPDRRLVPPRTDADLARWLATFSTATAGMAAAPPAAKGNLVRNGTFEEALTGVASPVGWDRMDRLTSFWGIDALDPRGHGHVLTLDTDVYESEWKRRQEEMRRDPDSPTWPKTPVPERDQYATVGGNHGVSVYGDPIPVEPGRPYRLSLACRTELPAGEVKVWVRGFGTLDGPRGPEERRLFDALSTVRMASPGWNTHSYVFHPTKNTPSVATMRVMLYGYWPRGRYVFDDVSLVAISDAEYATAKETERSEVK